MTSSVNITSKNKAALHETLGVDRIDMYFDNMKLGNPNAILADITLGG